MKNLQPQNNVSKLTSLESLLATFDKNEELRADTEALRPRLENEINAALASGDVLDEKIATSLQTKRGQLDLIPAKLGQISTKSEELQAAIQAEFQVLYNAFGSELRALQDAESKRIIAGLTKLGLEQNYVEALVLQGISTRTNLSRNLAGLDSPISFQVAQKNIVQAARELLKSETGLAQLKANQSN
jgi:hypothetical protein